MSLQEFHDLTETGSDVVASKETLIIEAISEHCPSSDQNVEFQELLSDIENSDFSNLPFVSIPGDINYVASKAANPFDKLSKHYGRNKNVFAFISILRHKEQSELIINAISGKIDEHPREKVVKRKDIYLDRIKSGESDAKEFLLSKADAFFHGYHVECPGHTRNIHENLNINIIEPGYILEASSLFNRPIINREESSEMKRIKVYTNGKQIATVQKNGQNQRCYSFTKFALCNFEICWIVKNLFGENVFCKIALNVNCSQVNIIKCTVNKHVTEPKKMLEFAKQNETVLIKNETLYKVLSNCGT